MATKYTKEQLTCPECAAEGIEFVAKDMRGLNGHRMFKHGVHPSAQLPLEKQDLLISNSKLAQILDERLGIISEQLDGLQGTVDALNDKLEQEQQERHDNVTELNERLATAEAKTIADFPAEEKAKYFIGFMRRLDNEGLAKLAKATELEISRPSKIEASDKMVKEIERIVKEGKAKRSKEPEVVKGIVKGERKGAGWKYFKNLDISYKLPESVPEQEAELEDVETRRGKVSAPGWKYLEHLDLSYRLKE